MCGIAALIAPKKATDLRAIKGMTEIIRHRGPDDEGYLLIDSGKPTGFWGEDTPDDARLGRDDWANAPSAASVALGHRRLSILDTSAAGHQPMADGGGKVWLVHNGEIYNFVELRDELETLGLEFRTQTDTEVVIAAYKQWGVKCLSRFNGMFAFVLVDLERNRLFAARDRFGVKPLYYWKSPRGVVAFASEIKQFTVLDGWQAELNHARAYDYLNWGLTDHTAETLFEGVKQIPAGHYMELSLDRSEILSPKSWYRLEAARVEMSLEEAGRRFRELFEDSVKLRLRADVPLGTGLSGGLDSSSIVCAVNDRLKKTGGAQQHTFSAAAEDSRYDETPFIKQVIEATGVDAHFTYPDPKGLIERLDTIVWHQDEPFGSTSIFAEWEVFDLVTRNKVKVTLDGHGADETLAGYHVFFGALLADLFRKRNWRALKREMAALKECHGYGWSFFGPALADALSPNWLRELLRKFAGKTTAAAPWLNLKLNPRDKVDPFDRSSDVSGLSVSQMLHTSLPLQLHWCDRDSMAHSIESRAPFLDYRLVEFIVSCAPSLRIGGGETKRLLRQGMADLLPEAITKRQDKIGFITPEERWVREDDPDLFRRLADQAVEQSKGVLNTAARDKAEAIVSGRQPYNAVLWRMICFGAWMKRFDVSAERKAN